MGLLSGVLRVAACCSSPWDAEELREHHHSLWGELGRLGMGWDLGWVGSGFSIPLVWGGSHPALCVLSAGGAVAAQTLRCRPPGQPVQAVLGAPALERQAQQAPGKGVCWGLWGALGVCGVRLPPSNHGTVFHRL